MEGLAAQFTAINQAQLQTRVDYAVLRKILDSQADAGNAAVKLVESAARSQQRVVEAVSAIGADGRLDAVA